MNWLAHLVLSRRDIAFQLGNVLADPLKGKPWPGASPLLAEGMSMHKAIDRFTDAHPTIIMSKSRLGVHGLLRGVAVDVIYDHFLAIRWDRYVRVSLDVFLETFHVNAIQVAVTLPERARLFVERLVRSEMLSSYIEAQGVALALQRVDGRLSQRLSARETTSEYFDVFLAEYNELLADFDQFFPELVTFFDAHTLGGCDDSYLRQEVLRAQ